jgi:F-type H+-transporting ATPase subunit delta
MAEIATIARPYAEALFQASETDLHAAGAWLERVAEVSANPDLRVFADSPKATAEQMMGIIGGAMEAPLPPHAVNFLTMLLENGRFSALPEIARQFRLLASARSGSSEAIVYSAFPIDAAALGMVSETLEKRFGRKLQISVREDASLIGGVRVVVGDEVLDTSVRARLEQMKVALAA